MIRNKLGQNTRKLFKHSTWSPIALLASTVILGAIVWRPEPIEPYRPLIGVVEAKEVVQTIIDPYGAPKNISDKIISLFGEDSQKMLKIIGTCENGTWDQTRTNTNSNGTKDWGLAQINDANSKLCKGLDFRGSWSDNLECAHRVYKSQGLKAWACSHTVGILPFYMRSK